MKEHIGEKKLTGGDLLVAAGGIALLAGGLASIHGHEKNIGNTNQKVEIEKSGDHNSIVRREQPGTGTMHTKSGDFHVTQK